MGKDPDQLTDDIAATRARMSGTVEEVRTRVSPTQAVQRRTESAREALRDGGVAVAERAEHVADDAKRGGRRAMQAVSDTTKEKPLLVGAAAFGAGLLLGVLAPGTETERRAARQLGHDVKEPLRDAVSESARHVSDDVRDRAAEARDQVSAEARAAMDDVRDEAGEVADHARERANEASDDVREEIQRRT